MAAPSSIIVVVTEQSPPPLPWVDAPAVPSAPEVDDDEELGLREARGRLVPLLLPLPLLHVPRKPNPREAPIPLSFADADADAGAEADTDADVDAEEEDREATDSSILEATDDECSVVVDRLDRVRLGGGGAGTDKDGGNG